MLHFKSGQFLDNISKLKLVPSNSSSDGRVNLWRSRLQLLHYAQNLRLGQTSNVPNLIHSSFCMCFEDIARRIQVREESIRRLVLCGELVACSYRNISRVH